MSKYVLKSANDKCGFNSGINPGYSLISTLDECKSAVGELSDSGLDIVFDGTITSSRAKFPKGCYKDQNSENAFWNTHNSGSTNEDAQPICRVGE